MIKTQMQRRGFLTIGTMAAFGTLAAPAVVRAQSGTATLADTLAGDARFSRFLDLVVRGSYEQDLRQAAPLTLFVPINSAFQGAPENLIAMIAGTGGNSTGNNNSSVDRERLGALLGYHAVPGAFRASELVGTDRRLRTKNGADLSISGTTVGTLALTNPAPGQQIGGFRAAGMNVAATPAKIVQADIPASNGIIHAIDGVLFP